MCQMDLLLHGVVDQEEWEGKGREGKGREGKGREGKGREGKGAGKGTEGTVQISTFLGQPWKSIEMANQLVLPSEFEETRVQTPQSRHLGDQGKEFFGDRLLSLMISLVFGVGNF